MLFALPANAQVVANLAAQQHGTAKCAAVICEVEVFNVTNGSTSQALSGFTGSIPSGDLAFINWKQDTNNTTTVTAASDGSNSWTCTTPNTADTAMAMGFCYSFVATPISGSSPITLTWANATLAYKVGDVLDVPGSYTALDTPAANTAATFGTAVSAPITTSSANTIIFSQVGEESAIVYTVGGSFTDYKNLTSAGGRRTDFCYRVVSSSGTYNPSGSYASNANWIGSTIAFH
jgi:hypothetical protein